MGIEHILNEVERERRRVLVISLYEEGLSDFYGWIKLATIESLGTLHTVMPNRFTELCKKFRLSESTIGLIKNNEKEFVRRKAKPLEVLNNAKSDEDVESYDKGLISYIQGVFERVNESSWELTATNQNKFVESYEQGMSNPNEDVRYEIAKSLKSLAAINPGKFVELYKKGLNDGYVLVKREIGESLGYLTTTITHKFLVAIKDEEYNFINCYLNSKYVHLSNDKTQPFRSEEDIITELKKFVQNPKRDYEKLTTLLKTGKVKDLEEMAQCAEETTRDHLLTHILGKGAYKVAYSGIHQRWGQEHAVKVIHLSPRGKQILEAKGLTSKELMGREDQRSASIREYGFETGTKGLQSFRYSYSEGGKLVIVEKKLAKTLQQLVEGYEKEHRHIIPWKMAQPYLYETARLISILHSRKDDKYPNGHYHGDLALKNVMVDEEKVVYLTDYGIYSALYDTKAIYYRAPELFPWHPHHVDPLSHDVEALKAGDIWALGVCAWRILTGELPFKVEGLEKPPEDGSMPYDEYVKAIERYERAFYEVLSQTKFDSMKSIQNSAIFQRAINARRKAEEYDLWEKCFGTHLSYTAAIAFSKNPKERLSRMSDGEYYIFNGIKTDHENLIHNFFPEYKNGPR